jgi:hypothetical protein
MSPGSRIVPRSADDGDTYRAGESRGLSLSAAWMARADGAAEPGPPTNLQVLPAQLSRASVRSLMKQYERALGVSCSYCHVEDRDSGVIDYASDENPRKHTADS